MLVPAVVVLKSTPVETGTLTHPGWVWPETHQSGSEQSGKKQQKNLKVDGIP